MTTTRILTPVPAVPPRPPGLNLVTSSIQPDDTTDGRWTGGFAYAPENQYPAEVRETCNETTEDEQQLAAPAQPTVTHAAGSSSITSGAKVYEVTYVNTNGETTPSTASAAYTATAGDVITVHFAAPPGPDWDVNVYGRVAGSLGLIGTVAYPGTTFVDNGTVTPGAAPPSTNTTGGGGSYGNESIVSCLPYVVLVEDSCSTFGFEARDFIGRATRLLDNATPNAMEDEFWTGTLTQAAGTGNNYLTNASSVTDLTPGTVPSITRAIQILEDALAGAGFGGQGMIHAMPQAIPNFLGARRVGPQLLTVADNIVVPGSGYTGTGPVGNANATPPTGQTWLYATDLVSVRIDKAQVFPDNFQEALDRGYSGQPNRITFRAERFAAATFDGYRHFACRAVLAS